MPTDLASADLAATDDVVDSLTRTLIRACRKLAEAGEPQLAGQIAAQGWMAVRPEHTRAAQRLDGAMHYIARLEQQLESQHNTDNTEGTTMAESTLDVRTEEPRRRHELIFETFGTLPVGDSYVLVNDHDPKPLRYQLEAEHTGTFSWEYLEEGPEVWRVRIGRTAPDAN